MSHFCKTCRYLEAHDYPVRGRAGDTPTEKAYHCGWFLAAALPWADAAALAAQRQVTRGARIGKRHIEGDWSEVMDCPTWESRKSPGASRKTTTDPAKHADI